MANSTISDDCFLPNFCGLRMVFVVVVIAQLFAFVVVLSPSDLPAEGRWQQLGLISLFVQWCTLVSSAVLCLLRRWIHRASNRVVALASYAAVLLVVWAVSELAYWYVYPGARNMTHWSFVLRNVAISFLITGPILRYFYVTHQWRRNVRAEAEARLQSLQSRIRPHFLFNSMNTIASLTRTSPEQAEAAVEDLADLFRVTLRDARELHTLAEELTLCRRYLEIEGLRLGDRLKLEWAIEDLPSDALLPPLLIQPLLENAIYHGWMEARSAYAVGAKANNLSLRSAIQCPLTRVQARATRLRRKIFVPAWLPCMGRVAVCKCTRKMTRFRWS